MTNIGVVDGGPTVMVSRHMQLVPGAGPAEWTRSARGYDARMNSTTRRTFLSALAGLPAASRLAARALGAARHRCPGFCDLQVNGFAGVDFNDPSLTAERLAAAADAMRRTGVTRFLPTLISAPLARFAVCARTIVRARVDAVAGLHMEGPYISPDDGPRGAHRREDVSPPSPDDFARRQDAADGRIVLVTLAPEVPGALALVERLVGQGVKVAVGHTAASPEQIRDAIRAGATLSTHLGNGCAQMLPRHPNFLWEQLAADTLFASLIVDGHHLPPATVKTMVRAKTPARTILVTDAIAAAGQPPGEYDLGNVRVRLDETGRVAVPGAPNLAGSALSMDRAVANTVKFTGVALETALAMASTQPAGYLGIAPVGTLDVEWDQAGFRLTVLKIEDGRK
jgi:N-acetylglucosamine-6-phosphate deacetylase